MNVGVGFGEGNRLVHSRYTRHELAVVDISVNEDIQRHTFRADSERNHDLAPNAVVSSEAALIAISDLRIGLPDMLADSSMIDGAWPGVL